MMKHGSCLTGASLIEIQSNKLIWTLPEGAIESVGITWVEFRENVTVNFCGLSFPRNKANCP